MPTIIVTTNLNQVYQVSLPDKKEITVKDLYDNIKEQCQINKCEVYYKNRLLNNDNEKINDSLFMIYVVIINKIKIKIPFAHIFKQFYTSYIGEIRCKDLCNNCAAWLSDKKLMDGLFLTLNGNIVPPNVLIKSGVLSENEHFICHIKKPITKKT